MEFDLENMKRIHALLLLKGRCNTMGICIMDFVGFSTKQKNNSFFTTILSMLDGMIFNLMNLEYRIHFKADLQKNIFDHIKSKGTNFSGVREIEDNAEERIPEVYRELFIASSIRSYEDNIEDMVNFYIGSMFLSFSVDVYSAFEFWIDKIYLKMINKYSPEEGKIKKARKFLRSLSKSILEERFDKNIGLEKKSKRLVDRYAKCEEIAAEEIKKEYMSYDSSYFKISFVVSKLSTIKKEERIKIMETVSNLGLIRNCIHNLGINKSKSKTIKFSNDEYIVAEHGKKIYSSSYICNVLLFQDILEVYRVICLSYFNEFNNVDPLFQTAE